MGKAFVVPFQKGRATGPQAFCRGNIDAPAKRQHLPLRVCRRELLATAHPDTESVATSAPLTSVSIRERSCSPRLSCNRYS